MLSQCSSELFQVVRAAVGSFRCPAHLKDYTRMRNFELLCDECPNADKGQPISAFFDMPLLSLVKFYSPLKEIDPEVLTPQFLGSVKGSLHQSKQALNACLSSLEKSVVAQCRFMREAYERLSNDSVRRLQEHLGYLEGVNRIYLDYFYEKLETAELKSPEHVVSLLRDFVSGSEDPTNSLTLRLDYIRDIVQDFPFLKLDNLKQLYEQTCDPSKWQLSRFMDNASREEQPVVEANLIKLLDRQHLLRFDSERIQCLNFGNKIVGEVEEGADLCFQIDRFRLAACHREGIAIYSYLNPSHIKRLAFLPVRYPKNMRWKQGHLYFVAEGKLQRYNVDSGTTIIMALGKIKEFKMVGDTLLVMGDKTFERYHLGDGRREALTRDEYDDVL